MEKMAPRKKKAKISPSPVPVQTLVSAEVVTRPPAGTLSLQDIPAAIMAVIFSYTCLYVEDWRRLALVCKRLHAAALMPAVHARLVVTAFNVPVLLGVCRQLSGLEKLRIYRESANPKYDLSTAQCKLVGNSLKRLQSLDVSGTNVTVAGAKALFDGCRRLQSIAMNFCNKINEEVLKALAESQRGTLTLRNLSLHTCKYALVDEGIMALSSITSLEVLCFSGGTGLTFACFDSLAKLIHLRELDLSYTRLGSIKPCNWQYLSENLPSLAKLVLAGNKFLTQQCFRQIGHMKQLDWLGLWDIQMTYDNLQQLVPLGATLKSLILDAAGMGEQEKALLSDHFSLFSNNMYKGKGTVS